ncbi:CopG family ribbon-helix-helix protein [Rhizobium sp. SL42]|uniref:CopG family ribbon-helix-helix protein n=1 Tax=Rhizobium sp. SL42 TaxID=2806346 RepID=UPI001F017A3C|nr:ribbon-helix-helix protein, CopG family [Rhizobium sp. SL42]UJW74747.1 ribbon-helix-helix protein, CopG family [Rhizobium sp. SL42]
MKNMIVLSDDITQRLDELAERTRLTREQIVEDALTHGRSLAWREKWAAGVREGMDDADACDFAEDHEIAVVLEKFKN